MQGQNKEFLEQKWKPGQSGNPKGRKKGTLNYSTIAGALAMIVDSYEGEIDNTILGKELKNKKVDGRFALALTLFNKALSGDLGALKESFERLDGKVPESLTLTKELNKDDKKLLDDIVARRKKRAITSEEAKD